MQRERDAKTHVDGGKSKGVDIAKTERRGKKRPRSQELLGEIG